MGIKSLNFNRNYPNWKSWTFFSPFLIYLHFNSIQYYGVYYYPDIFDIYGIFQFLVIDVPQLFCQGVQLYFVIDEYPKFLEWAQNENKKEKELRKQNIIIKNKDIGLNEPMPSGMR